MSKNNVTFVKYFAHWCAPCKSLSPVIEAVKGENPGVSFSEVDIDSSPETAQANHVRNIPLVIVEGPNGTERISGMNPVHVYNTAIKKVA